MKNTKFHCRFFVAAAVVFCLALPAEASRFWIAVGKKVPKEFIIDQLLNKPNSLKNMGDDYKDGWAIGYYDGDEPLVFRGSDSAFTDEYFDRAVYDISDLTPSLVIGHLRRATSGCRGAVNPHPFERVAGGKTWLFGHNGAIDKKILIELIGETYLEKNPPKSCPNNPPDSWIDSELYFIYLLKEIEKAGGYVEDGLKNALNTLRGKIEADRRELNFFLTDGKTVWGYREGNTLFYKFDPKMKVTVFSSSVPDYKEDGWKNFPEAVIGVVDPSKETRFNLLTTQTDAAPAPAAQAADQP